MTAPEASLPLAFVPGDATGLAIPATPEALRAGGEAFLTESFRCFGSLAADNSVVKITRFAPHIAGSSGLKISLSVEYLRNDPGLHRNLFVKFSRNFHEGHRDRRRFELESEIRLAALSRLPAFPIRVATAYFADFQRETGTGLLITERIPYGVGDILPFQHKCMDHELADPLAYYRALLSALAKLAAAHKAGRLSPEAETSFPFSAEASAAEDPIPYTEEQLRGVIANYAAFAAECAHLLPRRLTTPAFIAKLERDAIHLLRHEMTIKRYLQANPDFIALSHFNAHIDNAWFRRLPSGGLECGLMDWQRARQMNVSYAIWGCLSGAHLDVWDHIDDLLIQFTDELHAHGGPKLDVAELRLHLDLYTAMISLAQLIESPAIVLARMPDVARRSGPRDPLFDTNEGARTFLSVFTVLLNLWQTDDFGACVDRVVAATS